MSTLNTIYAKRNLNWHSELYPMMNKTSYAVSTSVIQNYE